MIVVRLFGGLGNQMFQYAMARSLADRYDVPLKLDVSGFVNYTLRQYELGDFNIRAGIADGNDLDVFRLSANQLSFWTCMKNHIPLLAPRRVFREFSFLYDERVHTINPPVYLDGYWQSERYFAHNSEALRRDFTLRDPLDTDNMELLKKIETTNALSLHVRRGDYMSDQGTNEVHGVCPREYYQTAVEHIAGRVKYPHIFVFSDDSEWAEDNLNLGYPVTFVNVNSKGRGVFDMTLMRNCQHHIIANSSFSWWGAWLNPSVNKIVVAPQAWFNKASHDTSDLIPLAWVRL